MKVMLLDYDLECPMSLTDASNSKPNRSPNFDAFDRLIFGRYSASQASSQYTGSQASSQYLMLLAVPVKPVANT